MKPAMLTRRDVVGRVAATVGCSLLPLPAAARVLTPRLNKLLAEMTLEEKAGQLTLMSAAWGGSGAAAQNPPAGNTSFDAQLEAVRRGQLTGVFNGAGAGMAKRMQLAAMREARLPIPLLFAADVIHGYRTIFPVPLAEAASFDPDLATRNSRIAAIEAAAAGIDWTFAPMVDIARDQRWGRGVEGAGEDVLLGRLMAAARVSGFQGSGLTAPDAVAACAKHFAAYGAAEGGLDYNSVDISERTLREVYFPPFAAALAAGAPAVMAAFNELAGVPATGNHWLLTDVLRGEWRFRGLVVSDYTGDLELVAHGFARHARDAARIAFLAGVDMSMQSGLYLAHLPDLVRSGDVPQARLDEAVGRVLAFKAALGLFDDPFRRIDPVQERRTALRPAHRRAAREAAARSIVLLRNEGELLPLPRRGRRIALVGPFAEGAHDLVGPWTIYGSDAEAVDLATGLRAAMDDPALLSVVSGSGVEAALPGGIAAAMAAVQAADIIVLALGEGAAMSGEAQSRTAITVPQPQMALAEAVLATGKPVVVLLTCGRALALERAILSARAVLVTWFLGTESGHGIADILFGAAAPSARLPVSFPMAAGQQPYHYGRKSTGRPNPPGPRLEYKTQYREVPNAARFPFGHGLTYGRILYEELTVIKTGDGAPLRLRARLRNTGGRDAVEVVQLYGRFGPDGRFTPPAQELMAFQRIAVPAGTTREVTFVLPPDVLERTKPAAQRELTVWVAPSAEVTGLTSTIKLGPH